MWWRQTQKQIIMSINSLRPSDASMRQQNKPSLVQLMACRLFGAKPFSEPMLEYFQLDPRNKLQWVFNRNINVFIQENTYVYVAYVMADILFRPQCDK